MTEVRPASEFLEPGTIIVVRRRGPVEAEILCTKGAAFGTGVVVESSPAATQDVTDAARHEHQLSLSLLPQVSGRNEYAGVRSLTFGLSNTTLRVLSRAAMFASVKDRSPSCQAAVDDALADSAEVTVVTDAILADFRYRVVVDDTLTRNAEAKGLLLGKLAGQLNTRSIDAATLTLGANGLIWAIRDNARFGRLRPDGSFGPGAGRGGGTVPDGPILDRGDAVQRVVRRGG